MTHTIRPDQEQVRLVNKETEADVGGYLVGEDEYAYQIRYLRSGGTTISYPKAEWWLDDGGEGGPR